MYLFICGFTIRNEAGVHDTIYADVFLYYTSSGIICSAKLFANLLRLIDNITICFEWIN